MESQSGVILNSDYPFLGRAMGTAIERVSSFHPVSNNSTVAVFAGGSEGMDCTFEAIKDVGFLIHNELKAFVILIAADFTSCHFLFSPFN